MNGIIVREDEAFEKALRRFTKSCERAGVLSDVKKCRHYEKPSEEKKRKLNASRRKRMREES
ncbi:MAG: 30S ribosomal protein S21, partial [Chitinivibrionales bacterium]|nr:30S ribosomal protein S21 [Chitinivibrionales bacterium]MBD3395445.1 30S ribosomal protein S21 [Chitinivibrionales bacterium]